MGRRLLGMGDQHEELHSTGKQDMHTASSEDEDEEEEEEDVSNSKGELPDPRLLPSDVRALMAPVATQELHNTGDQLILDESQNNRVDAPDLQKTRTSVLDLPPSGRDIEAVGYQPGGGRLTRAHELMGSSLGTKTKKRCSVLCTVYCIESDLSGDLPNDYPADQGNLSDAPTRTSQLLIGSELPLSPASVELELSPFLINSLGDSVHKVVMSCRVCLEDKPIKPLPCCKKSVCEECLKRYLSSQVQLGQVEIKCPITECNKHLDESTILYSLPHDDIIKYKYFLELSRMDSSTKPCPQCMHFTTFKRKSHIPNPTKSENKFKIQCPSCQFVWCFKCHSPWHEGVNCREYKKGDKLLRHWANEIEHGQRNAQKCPRCKVHIQRTEGCDHMTCSQCNTNFCYRCGERYRQLRFFGDHTSNLSIFGCKYRYLPERPHVRRLVRGSVCAGKLLIAPLLLVLGLALGAIAVVIGLFGLPVYCLCKKQRKRTRTDEDMESSISTVEAEYIKNLQQQIYFLELEASFLREQTKKAKNLQPRLTSETEHMNRKLQELQSQYDGLKLEVKRRDANLLALQRDEDRIREQVNIAEESHSKEKQNLVEEIVRLKKMKEHTDLQISQKEMEILHSKQELERELASLTNSEQKAHSLQSQIKQRSEQQKAVENQLSEKRMEILKVNSAMHEMEEKLFKHTAATQDQITLDLRNEISFLHQQIREKDLLSEQEHVLRSKMSSDCAALSAENNALQKQLMELNKQLDIQRTFKEESYSYDSSSILQLLSVKDREEQLNNEVKWQQELLQLEKKHFKDIMEQITVLQSGNVLQGLNVNTVSSQIEELKSMLAKEEQINTELRRDKTLLVDHVSNLQTQIAKKDAELLHISSRIEGLEDRMSTLKSEQELHRTLQSERWKEISDMAGSMKKLSRSLVGPSVSFEKF